MDRFLVWQGLKNWISLNVWIWKKLTRIRFGLFPKPIQPQDIQLHALSQTDGSHTLDFSNCIFCIFRGESSSGFRYYIQNQKDSGSNPTRCLLGSGTQPRYEAPGDLQIEISKYTLQLTLVHHKSFWLLIVVVGFEMTFTMKQQRNRA